MKAKFKLSQMLPKDKRDITIQHPVLGDTGLVITIAGPTHPAFKDALADYRLVADADASTIEQTTEANHKLLASVFLAWDDESMEMPCTPENVLKLVKDEKMFWLTSQVQEAVLDHTSFFCTAG